MKKNKNLLITTGISLIIVILSICYLNHKKESIFKWKDPTAELRNTILGLAAVGGFPFLILGHVTKRNDLEEKRNDLKEKRKDLLYKSESQMGEQLSYEILNAITRFKEILKSSPTKNDTLSLDEELTKQFGNHLKKTSVFIPSKKLITEVWESPMANQLAKEGSIICNGLTLIYSFQNKEILKVQLLKLANEFSDDFTIKMFFIIISLESAPQYFPWKNSGIPILKSHFEELKNLGMLSTTTSKHLYTTELQTAYIVDSKA